MSKPWDGFYYWVYTFFLGILIHGCALVLYYANQSLLFSFLYAVLGSLSLGLLFLFISQTQHGLYKERFLYYGSFSFFLAPFLVLIPLLFILLLFDPVSLGSFGGGSDKNINSKSQGWNSSDKFIFGIIAIGFTFATFITFGVLFNPIAGTIARSILALWYLIFAESGLLLGSIIGYILVKFLKGEPQPN